MTINVNDQFNKWTVLAYVGKKNSRHYYHVRCACGTIGDRDERSLQSGRSKSCGCYRSEWSKINKYKHGGAVNFNTKYNKEYRTWIKMRDRCNNPNNKDYSYYGGRGISVCSEWDSYAQFIQDVGMAPTPRHSIDRIDTNGRYEPGNVRWATREQQSRNRRPYRNRHG